MSVLWNASGVAGMEYPTLFTGGSLWHFPEEIRYIPEDVTIHEFGHQSGEPFPARITEASSQKAQNYEQAYQRSE